MTNFYRRIPRVVRALQFILTDSFEAELRDFAGDRATLYLNKVNQDTRVIVYGFGSAMPGDWIVQKHPEPVFTVITAELFAHDYEPFPAPLDPPKPGTLLVGVDDRNQVVINHPQLDTDAQGCGHIVFSAYEADLLADLLKKHAEQARKNMREACRA